MSREEQFRNVEEILSTFPEEARQNYYKNKESLEIVSVDFLSDFTSGTYDCKDNKLKLFNRDALEHELFHIAFNDKEKYGKEIASDIYLDNGVAYFKEGSNRIQGIGLTEGFAENLAIQAKVQNTGREFQAYIIELLVSIYGRELYLFPLKNDPIGFYKYCSENMVYIREYLDIYTETLTYMGDIANDPNIDKKEVSGNINLLCNYIPKSIIKVIEYIAKEYNSCTFPKVTRIEFKTKIKNILTVEEISLAIALSNQIGINLKQKIEDIVDDELMDRQYIKK